jgi:hypothetical protein
MQKHPLWGVDTSKWTRGQHIKAWALFIPYAIGVTILGWFVLSVLRSL